LGEAPAALDFVPLDGLLRDEGAGSLLCAENSTDLQFFVSPDDGVWVDGEVDGNLPDCGELQAGGECSSRDSCKDLVDELAINGDTGKGIEPKAEGTLLKSASHLE
jgi:hypothetical protein